MSHQQNAEALMRIFEMENKQLVKMALFAVNQVCDLFELEGRRPILHVAFTEEHVAYQENEKIIISLGTFLRAKELQSLLPASAKKSLLGRFPLDAWQAAALFIFWIVAHETIHFGRCHSSAPNSSHCTVARGLEYEADCLASLALFRLLKDSELLGRERRDEDVLRVTYGVMYWQFRHCFFDQEGGRSPTNTHPSWMVRSTYCFSFLLAFAIVPGEAMGNLSPEAGKRFDAAVQILTDIVKCGEDAMFEVQGGEIVEVKGKSFKKSFLEFVEVFGDKSNEAKQCMRSYKRISADLDLIQRFKVIMAQPESSPEDPIVTSIEPL